MTFRIAVVQPLCPLPGHDENNVAEAVQHVERSAAEGAHFVCFPETYPGPWRMPVHFDPTAAMAEAAARRKVHVVFGTIEPISHKDATAYNLICMAYPDGQVVRYRRTHPKGRGSTRAAMRGSSSGCRATRSRCSTPRTARSGSPCAARSTCRRSRAPLRCAAPRS